MRAPRARRWGLEPIRGGRSRSWEEGWGEGPRRKEGRQASAGLQSPFPSSHPSQRPLLWEYVRARKSKSPHSHSPLDARVPSSGIPK